MFPCKCKNSFILKQVLLINSLASMDSDTFTVLGRNWSVLLSNGSQVALRINKDGNPENLDYNDRMQYAQEARNIIMNESQEQVCC